MSLLTAILILIACHEAGRLVLTHFGPDRLLDKPVEILITRFAAGYIVLEFVLSVLAFFHLIFPVVLWILICLLLVSALVFGRTDTAKEWHGFRDLSRNLFGSPLNTLLATIAIVVLLMDFLLTFAPTTAWDSLTYHYPLPLIWLMNGGFVQVPDICYQLLPMASEMLFLLAFGIGGSNSGPLAANHLTWATGVLAVIALINLARKLGGNGQSMSKFWDPSTPGLIAALAFLSLPIVYFEEMEGGYIENFLVFMSLTMLTALLEFRKTRKVGLIPLIGILAGGLLASKHTSVFVCALVLLILIWTISSRRIANPGREAAWLVIAIVLALIPPSVWYLKSYIAAGDPFYPFLTAILKPDTPIPDIMYWSNPNVHRSFWGFLAYVYSLTRDVSLVQFNFRLLSWYFLPMLPFAIWWSVRGPAARPVGLVAFALILVNYILAPGEPRYMLDAWAVFAALGAWGLMQTAELNPKIGLAVLPILLSIPIAFSMVDRTHELNRRLPVISGSVSRQEYLENNLDIGPLIKYVLSNTAEDERVIMVEPRIWYLHREYRIWYPFPTQLTQDWLLMSPSELAREWQRDWVKYLLLSYGPNYRALALVRADRRRTGGYLPDFVRDLPDWALLRASYAEPTLTPDGDIRAGFEEELASRLERYDCQAVELIMKLIQEGYLVQIDKKDNVGIVFRVISDKPLLTAPG
jgi:hypothetical protein